MKDINFDYLCKKRLSEQTDDVVKKLLMGDTETRECFLRGVLNEYFINMIIEEHNRRVDENDRSI